MKPLTMRPDDPRLVPVSKLPPAIRDAFERAGAFWTARTHTEIVLGDAQRGHTVKIICDSTGGVTELPWDVVRCEEKTPYPRCRFCGAESQRWKGRVIDAEAEILVDTDTIDAWPALP